MVKIAPPHHEEKIVTKICRCGETYQAKEFFIRGTRVVNQVWCPQCSLLLHNEWIKPEREPRKSMPPDRWKEICPPLYQDTDVARLTIPPAIVARVLAWEPNPRGIALSGTTGTGKTRLIFLLIRRLLETTRLRVVSAKQFERWVHRMFEKENDARLRIEECRETKILFIDDIGKEKYTERVESEFYDLVEYRTSNLRPILWTTNANGAQLEQMMAEDRGIPIVRRLREFTEIISV